MTAPKSGAEIIDLLATAWMVQGRQNSGALFLRGIYASAEAADFIKLDTDIVTPLCTLADLKSCRAQRDKLAEALRELVERCDGAEGVREDGSNIQTMKAHAALEDTGVSS